MHTGPMSAWSVLSDLVDYQHDKQQNQDLHSSLNRVKVTLVRVGLTSL